MTKMNEVRKSARKRIAKILHDDKTSLQKYTELDLKDNENITYDSGSYIPYNTEGNTI